MAGSLIRVEVAPGDVRSLSSAEAAKYGVASAFSAGEKCPTCDGTGVVAPNREELADLPSGGEQGASDPGEPASPDSDAAIDQAPRRGRKQG